MSGQMTGHGGLGKATQPPFGRGFVVGSVALLILVALAAAAVAVNNNNLERVARATAARRQLESAPFPAHVTGIPASELAISPFEEVLRFPGTRSEPGEVNAPLIGDVVPAPSVPYQELAAAAAALSAAQQRMDELTAPVNGDTLRYWELAEASKAVKEARENLDAIQASVAAPALTGSESPAFITEPYWKMASEWALRKQAAPALAIPYQELAFAAAALSAAEQRMAELEAQVDGDTSRYWEMADLSRQIKVARERLNTLQAFETRPRVIEAEGSTAYFTESYWKMAAEWAETHAGGADSGAALDEHEYSSRSREHIR